MNLLYPNMRTPMELSVDPTTKDIINYFCQAGIPKEKADNIDFKQGFKQAIRFLLFCDYLQDIEDDEGFQEYMADLYEGEAYERSLG